jgi:hypothetical protein
VLEAAHLVGDGRAPLLFEGQGFERVRSFHRMVIDVTVPTPSPSWPAGTELRPFEPNRHGPMLHAAEIEAFSDEWDYVALGYDEWHEPRRGG